MKVVGIREAQQHLGGLVGESQRQRVVLTRHGKPVAVLSGVEGRDMEEVLLASDDELWRLLERRRSAGAQLISHESLKRELGLGKQGRRTTRGKRA